MIFVEDVKLVIGLLLVQIFLLLFLTFVIVVFLKIKNRISINRKFKKYTIDNLNNKNFSLYKFKKYVSKVFIKKR